MMMMVCKMIVMGNRWGRKSRAKGGRMLDGQIESNVLLFWMGGNQHNISGRDERGRNSQLGDSSDKGFGFRL